MNFFKKLFGNSDKRLVKYSTDDYNKYFDNNTLDGKTLEFLPLGKVNLPTGQVIACDPLVCIHDSLPFNRTVNPGNYPVTVCIDKSTNRYAVVKLEFNTTKPTKWELAVHNDTDIADLTEEDAFVGFPVDAGLGCFCDQQTQKYYNEFVDDFYKKNPKGNIYDDLFAAEFKKNATNPTNAGDWINFNLPNRPDQNIVMFHSGYGDGLYPCYWGTNDNGDICCLVVDFLVL
ncbi:MAG: hypothetical protein POELPBGB_00588 [Bacteroidia bacterium]|nr:hypothetical protein [Bacteroidia bacterium]